ncbi:Versiconal hemiacetal acetate esterase [Lecanosticta acicola]|uniref:Versiconal hemiacetal acetate esterase n=1 Tax=Lecanosticta acicola TaxID=111012 RepID=A0AAI9ED51_9PEZI|nr:Versiconal hemiacetal acetate esterase [Lecanosticta acicola]
MAGSEVFRSEWLAFEEELGFRPLLHGPTYEGLVKQNTEIGLKLVERYDFPTADPSVSTAEEKTSNGTRVKIYTPPELKPDQPIVCYFHGGGGVFGGIDDDDYIVTRHCKDTGLVFVSVEYRLAPLHPHPAGFDDCVDAAKWCIENAKSLGNQRSKVLLMGVSAGATLALATALKLLHDHRTGEVEGVVACQPLTLHPDGVPEEFQSMYTSYDEHATHTINTKAAMKTFLDLIGASKSDRYLFSALNSHIKDLPCVYLNCCEADTLRDDARVLKKLLDRYGVPNEYDEYPGLPHFFFAYPTPELKELSANYFAKTAAGISFIVTSSIQSPLPLS